MHRFWLGVLLFLFVWPQWASPEFRSKLLFVAAPPPICDFGPWKMQRNFHRSICSKTLVRGRLCASTFKVVTLAWSPKHHLWHTQKSFDKFFVKNSRCNYKRFQIYRKEIFFVTIVQFEFKNFYQTFIKNQICKISSKLSIGIGNWTLIWYMRGLTEINSVKIQKSKSDLP